MTTGAEAKQLGLNLVESNNQVFMETMRSHARIIALREGSVTSDDLRAVADSLGIEPAHQNAWGAVFRGADWEPVGFEPSAFRTNRGRMIRRWGLKA